MHNIGHERDPIDHLHRRVNEANRKTDAVRNRLRTPTLPLYNSGKWPDEASRGQLVRDINDPDDLWVYGEDDEWHRIGAAPVTQPPSQRVNLRDLIHPGYNAYPYSGKYTTAVPNPNVDIPFDPVHPGDSWDVGYYDADCWDDFRNMNAADGGTAYNGCFFVVKVAFGPTGSLWSIGAEYLAGPDYGIFAVWLSKPS
jgi:hypothetical protein